MFSPDDTGNTDLRRVAVTYDKITNKIIFFRDKEMLRKGLPDQPINLLF